jgi:uncharacterized protein
MKLIAADSIGATPWRNGGGQTRELFTDAEAHTLGSAWRVRISLADIARDGPFSAFPGVQRHFAVVQGTGVVLTLDGVPHTLTPDSGPLAFSGELAPGCQLLDGPTRDLNLMLQGGAAGALLRVTPDQPWHDPCPWRACFVADAAVLLLPQGEALPLPACSLVTDLPHGPLRLQPSGPGPAYWVAVHGLGGRQSRA